jgi:hypothetical protein
VRVSVTREKPPKIAFVLPILSSVLCIPVVAHGVIRALPPVGYAVSGFVVDERFPAIRLRI